MSSKKLKLPKSIRKYIRMQKSLIRRQFGDAAKRQEALDELFNKFSHLVKGKRR